MNKQAVCVEAGRETDARLAVEVLGWYWGPIRDPFHAADFPALHRADTYRELAAPDGGRWHLARETYWWQWCGLPRYSTDPAAALEVVEHLRQRGWLVILKAMPDGLPFLAGAGMGPGEGQEIRVRYVCSGQWMKNLTVEDTALRIHAHPVGMADTLALCVCRCALECVAAEAEAER